MPADADPGTFILSDGKTIGKPSPSLVRTLGDLFRVYQGNLPTGAKEDTTLRGEKQHIKHLLRHLGTNKIVQTVKVADVQGYVKKRLKDSWREKMIRPDTIEKELTTLRLIWNWAVNQGYLKGPAPIKGVKLPKRNEKPPFMTREEIEKVIKRGGLTAKQEAGLWECLFLTIAEVQEVLDLRGKERRPRLHLSHVRLRCPHRS